MRRLFWIASLALAFGISGEARAQNSLGGLVVTTCGSPAAFPTAGRAGPFTVDTAGRPCPPATGVPVTPTGLTTTQVAAAPTATTFASLLAASATRKGCLVQNTGTTLGYIYFGATGSATTANAFQVAAGAAISCASQTGGVLTDNIAGTCASSTCAFIIGSQ